MTTCTLVAEVRESSGSVRLLTRLSTLACEPAAYGIPGRVGDRASRGALTFRLFDMLSYFHEPPTKSRLAVLPLFSPNELG